MSVLVPERRERASINKSIIVSDETFSLSLFVCRRRRRRATTADKREREKGKSFLFSPVLGSFPPQSARKQENLT